MIGTVSLSQLQKDFSKSLPAELVNALFKSYRELKENFMLGKHEPTELNAAKLCEVVYRILEFETTRKYTALGVEVRNLGQHLKACEGATATNDSVRFHIPRVATAIYDIRNKRGVGHVGGDVSPNVADATFVAGAADWIVAELVRLHYQCTLEVAQGIVDGLVQRRSPLVYAVGATKRVLNPDLTYAQQTLILLAEEFPASVSDDTIWRWTGHSNFAVYKRDVLRPLHRKRLIDYTGSTCTALPTGLRVVEESYSEWADFEPTL